jgi:hypothetical protein
LATSRNLERKVHCNKNPSRGWKNMQLWKEKKRKTIKITFHMNFWKIRSVQTIQKSIAFFFAKLFKGYATYMNILFHSNSYIESLHIIWNENWYENLNFLASSLDDQSTFLNFKSPLLLIGVYLWENNYISVFINFCYYSPKFKFQISNLRIYYELYALEQGTPWRNHQCDTKKWATIPCIYPLVNIKANPRKKSINPLFVDKSQ